MEPREGPLTDLGGSTTRLWAGFGRPCLLLGPNPGPKRYPGLANSAPRAPNSPPKSPRTLPTTPKNLPKSPHDLQEPPNSPQEPPPGLKYTTGRLDTNIPQDGWRQIYHKTWRQIYHRTNIPQAIVVYRLIDPCLRARWRVGRRQLDTYTYIHAYIHTYIHE